MTDEELGFILKIRAEPKEETHQLVYADWLADNDRLADSEACRVNVEFLKHPHYRNIVDRNYDARDGVNDSWKQGFELYEKLKKARPELRCPEHTKNCKTCFGSKDLLVDLHNPEALLNQDNVRIVTPRKVEYLAGHVHKIAVSGDSWYTVQNVPCMKCIEYAPDPETNAIKCSHCDGTSVIGEVIVPSLWLIAVIKALPMLQYVIPSVRVFELNGTHIPSTLGMDPLAETVLRQEIHWIYASKQNAFETLGHKVYEWGVSYVANNVRLEG